MEKVQFQDVEFVKARASQYQHNVCVEVALRPNAVGIRDSKDPEKHVLQFSRDEWDVFVDAVKAGEFDTPG